MGDQYDAVFPLSYTKLVATILFCVYGKSSIKWRNSFPDNRLQMSSTMKKK